MGKTRKQPYRKARAFDSSCRCHGGCPYCLANRMYKNVKRMLATQVQLRELKNGDLTDGLDR